MQSDLTVLNATDLVAGFQQRQFSPVEVVAQTLEAIEAIDPVLNVFVHLDADGAMQSAKASETRWNRGQPAGLLDGVPATVKDLAAVRGWPTFRGSYTSEGSDPDAFDSPQVARLRESGAILLGKTAQPEFAWKGLTDSPRFGITRNPWNLQRTPGGSSGGGAAGVAAFLGPLAMGTDGSGSVRIPAAFCGLVGFKPTYGVIPQHPRAGHLGDIVHTGPMTRTVTDAALMMQVMAGPDNRDWTAHPQKAAFRDRLTPRVQGLRIGFSPTLGYASVEPEIAAMIESVVRQFADLGAIIEEIDPGFEDPRDIIDMIYMAGSARVVFAFSEEARSRMDPGLVEFAGRGLGISAADYVGIAMMKRDALASKMALFHERYDLLVTPQLGLTALPADEDEEASPYDHWFDWAPFCYPFNLTQQPAATVPCGIASDGLPVALQIVGAKHADQKVFDAALAIEQVLGFRLPGRDSVLKACSETPEREGRKCHAPV